MTIRKFSWVLGGAYLLAGILFFYAVQSITFLLAESGVGFLLLTTRVLLWVRPLGWLAIMFLVSACVVLRDVRFRSRLLNPAVIVASWVAAGLVCVGVVCLARVLFQPICVFEIT